MSVARYVNKYVLTNVNVSLVDPWVSIMYGRRVPVLLLLRCRIRSAFRALFTVSASLTLAHSSTFLYRLATAEASSVTSGAIQR